MKATTVGAVAIVVAAILWGFDGIVLTPRLFNLSVPFVTFLVHAVPFLLMQPFLYSSYRAIFNLSKSGWLTLLLVSATGGVIGTLAIVKALFLVNFNQLSVVVLLQKLQPLFAIILAALLLKERLNKQFLLWALIAIGGGYLLTFGLHSPELTGENIALAALYSVIAAAAFGSATVFGKKLLGSLNFWQAIFGRFGLTTLLMLPYLFVIGAGVPFGEVTGVNWIILLLIALTSGSSAAFLYYWGLTRVRAMVATICELFLPISAVLFDFFINGTVLVAWQWIGALVMIGAITRISVKQE